MAKGIIAKKMGMTQFFDENGKVVPVTILQAGPCFVTQVKTKEKDSYEAIQIGFGVSREKLLTKPELGHLKKSGVPAVRFLREFRDTGLDLKEGQEVKPDIFEVGEYVKVTGISKGKGFQGVMKRHGFGGGRMTHGSKFHKAPGSMGASTFPSRVFKGKRLPGHTGSRTSTVTNLKVVHVDMSNSVLMVYGAVPGPRTTIVKVEAMKK